MHAFASPPQVLHLSCVHAAVLPWAHASKRHASKRHASKHHASTHPLHLQPLSDLTHAPLNKCQPTPPVPAHAQMTQPRQSSEHPHTLELCSSTLRVYCVMQDPVFWRLCGYVLTRAYMARVKCQTKLHFILEGVSMWAHLCATRVTFRCRLSQIFSGTLWTICRTEPNATRECLHKRAFAID